MPISKTCYFCKPVGKKECDACTNVTKSNFVGNADWLYIEALEKENEELKAKMEYCANVDKQQLQKIIGNLQGLLGQEALFNNNLKKENEELKRKIQSYKYEREKLHGYLANIPNNPSVDSLNQMSISNRYVYDPIIGGYVTKESKDEAKE
jgi:predicted RNase H-like nuclease (RuvC/YqgF family)